MTGASAALSASRVVGLIRLLQPRFTDDYLFQRLEAAALMTLQLRGSQQMA
jgi:hypothetical protein